MSDGKIIFFSTNPWGNLTRYKKSWKQHLLFRGLKSPFWDDSVIFSLFFDHRARQMGSNGEFKDGCPRQKYAPKKLTYVTSYHAKNLGHTLICGRDILKYFCFFCPVTIHFCFLYSENQNSFVSQKIPDGVRSNEFKVGQ